MLSKQNKPNNFFSLLFQTYVDFKKTGYTSVDLISKITSARKDLLVDSWTKFFCSIENEQYNQINLIA